MRNPLDRGDSYVAHWREVALAVAIGGVANVAARTSFGTTAGMVAMGLVAALLLGGRRIHRRDSMILIFVAVTLMPWLFARSSLGLTWLTMLAILSLLSLAAAVSRAGSLFDLRFSALLGHHGAMAIEWVYAIAMVNRRVRSNHVRYGSVARGALLAAPVVLVFGLLLGSADAVFARMLGFDNNLEALAGHLILTAVFALFALGFMSRSAHDGPGAEPLDGPSLGATEITTVLLSVLVLFVAFVLTQVVMLFEGADHIIDTVGLTRAQYARQGFFQLLWVTGLALVLLGALRFLGRSLRATEARRIKLLGLGVLTLTFLITVVSVVRLTLYVDAFGLSPLRLWSLAAAASIGVLIALYAVSLAGWRADVSWFPGAAVALVATVTLLMNIVNPDARVAAYNLDNPPELGPLDLVMIAGLSDDAIPSVVKRLGDLPTEDQAPLTDLLCARFDLRSRYGPLGSNRARTTADRLLDDLCPARPTERNRGSRPGSD